MEKNVSHVRALVRSKGSGGGASGVEVHGPLKRHPNFFVFLYIFHQPHLCVCPFSTTHLCLIIPLNPYPDQKLPTNEVSYKIKFKDNDFDIGILMLKLIYN